MRGLRTLATLAAISDEVSESAARTEEVDYAIAFAIPMNTLGLKIVCRDLYAEHADRETLSVDDTL
jgi:aromatic ring hydroxylase